jgi:hypothetical protein
MSFGQQTGGSYQISNQHRIMWNGAMRALPLKEHVRAAAQVPDGMSLA